jgi:hypothetical protein
MKGYEIMDSLEEQLLLERARGEQLLPLAAASSSNWTLRAPVSHILEVMRLQPTYYVRIVRFWHMLTTTFLQSRSNTSVSSQFRESVTFI